MSLIKYLNHNNELSEGNIHELSDIITNKIINNLTPDSRKLFESKFNELYYNYLDYLDDTKYIKSHKVEVLEQITEELNEFTSETSPPQKESLEKWKTVLFFVLIALLIVIGIYGTGSFASSKTFSDKAAAIDAQILSEADKLSSFAIISRLIENGALGNYLSISSSVLSFFGFKGSEFLTSVGNSINIESVGTLESVNLRRQAERLRGIGYLMIILFIFIFMLLQDSWRNPNRVLYNSVAGFLDSTSGKLLKPKTKLDIKPRRTSSVVRSRSPTIPASKRLRSPSRSRSPTIPASKTRGRAILLSPSRSRSRTPIKRTSSTIPYKSTLNKRQGYNLSDHNDLISSGNFTSKFNKRGPYVYLIKKLHTDINPNKLNIGQMYDVIHDDITKIPIGYDLWKSALESVSKNGKV